MSEAEQAVKHAQAFARQRIAQAQQAQQAQPVQQPVQQPQVQPPAQPTAQQTPAQPTPAQQTPAQPTPAEENIVTELVGVADKNETDAERYQRLLDDLKQLDRQSDTSIKVIILVVLLPVFSMIYGRTYSKIKNIDLIPSNKKEVFKLLIEIFKFPMNLLVGLLFVLLAIQILMNIFGVNLDMLRGGFLSGILGKIGKLVLIQMVLSLLCFYGIIYWVVGIYRDDVTQTDMELIRVSVLLNITIMFLSSFIATGFYLMYGN